MHQSDMSFDTVPAKFAAAFVTLDDIKGRQQGNNDSKPVQKFPLPTKTDPNVQVHHVKRAKIDIRQANPNKQRHSERAQVENPSPRSLLSHHPKSNTATTAQEPSSSSSSCRKHHLHYQPSSSAAPQRRQRVFENRAQRQQHHNNRRYPIVSKHNNKPANAPVGTGVGGISKLCSKIKEAAQIVRENYNAGVEAAALQSKSPKPRHRRHMPERQRDGNPSRTQCAICHGTGAVLYKETPGKPLCKGCLSLGFVSGRSPPPPLIEVSDHHTFQPTIPAPLRIRKREDRCTQLPTQEELAAGTWGYTTHNPSDPPTTDYKTLHQQPPTTFPQQPAKKKPLPLSKPRAAFGSPALYPPPRAAEHKIKQPNPSATNPAKLTAETKPAASSQRPNLRVNTTINNAGYTPASWRTVGVKGKEKAPTAPTTPATKKAHNRVTVTSIWDDDVPEGGYLDAELHLPVPAVPVLHKAQQAQQSLPPPRLPFMTPVPPELSRRDGSEQEGENDQKRFERRRRRYSPSVYSNREPSPTLEFGFQAVPEGRYENF